MRFRQHPTSLFLALGFTLIVGCAATEKRSYDISDEPPQASKAQLELRALKILRQAQAAALAGESRVAVNLYREALQAYEKAGDYTAQGAIHNDLGLLLRASGSLDRAAEILETGLALARKGSEGLVVAEAHYNLGLVHYERDRDQEALPHLQDALSLAQDLNNTELAGLSHNAIGNLQRRRNEMVPAIDSYGAAAEIWESQGRREFAAVAHMNMGYCHVLAGEAAPASKAFARAATLLEEVSGANRDALLPHLNDLENKARTDPEAAREKVLRVLRRKP